MRTQKQRKPQKIQYNKNNIPINLRMNLGLIEVSGELDPFEQNPRDPGGYMDDIDDRPVSDPRFPKPERNKVMQRSVNKNGACKNLGHRKYGE